ncbi:MAG: hypothetical protein INR71_01085 [Terriglobus roseus]|nr:hypothetical protein [Terriglobus roseus]
MMFSEIRLVVTMLEREKALLERRPNVFKAIAVVSEYLAGCHLITARVIDKDRSANLVEHLSLPSCTVSFLKVFNEAMPVRIILLSHDPAVLASVFGYADSKEMDNHADT